MQGDETYETLEACTDDGAVLTINNYDPSSDASSNLFYVTERGGKYIWYDGIDAPQNLVTGEEADGQCVCSYSCEEAKELADGLLEAMGVPARLVQVSLLKAGGYQAVNGDENEMTYVAEDDYTGYAFYYGRLVDDIPVAVTTSQYLPHEDTAPAWLYESIQILVTDEGISQVDWQFPVEKESSIANDVDILEFSDAAVIFEEMAPLVYQGNVEQTEDSTTVESSYDVKVDRVELNLMRIKDSGTERVGMYAPAWVFYGTETEHMYYTEEQFADDPNMDTTEPSPWIILAVNAIDGSIIDVMYGY